MEFVNDLKREEINEFVEKHPFSHYMKTYDYGKYRSDLEGYSFECVGIKDEDRLVGTAVILKKKEVYSRDYLYIPTGMCVDYNNEKYLDFFIDSLVEYARKEKASFVRIDPNVERCHRDIYGNLIEDGFSNEYITEYLKAKGFRHKGYGYAYNGSWINRYTLKIDLTSDIDTIKSRFTKSKQNVLKRHQEMGVSTRNGRFDELHYLVDFEWDLTRTQGFKPHDVAFFERIYNDLKDYVCFYITEIDLNQRISYLNEELASNKYKKDREAREAKEKELGEAVKFRNEYGEKPVIACGMFIRLGSNSWDLYTYNKKAFFNYKATDNLHMFAITDMKENGVIKYDMVGFSGVTSKDDPYYGLYDYKRSFGSDFYEHIGEFDYILNEKDYKRFSTVRKNINRVKRKLHSLKYKKAD